MRGVQHQQLFFCAPFMLVLATVFIIDNRLAHGVVSGKYFWFYGSIGLVCFASFLHCFTKKKLFRFSALDGFVILFIGITILTTLILNKTSVHATKITLPVLLFVLYILFRWVSTDNRQKIQSLICVFIIFSGLVEAIWGLMQLYGFLPSQHHLFKLTGSFFNPGPYAGYLAVVFPLALYFSWQKGFRTSTTRFVLSDILRLTKRWLSGITCFAIFLILPTAMSRSAWLAVMAGSIVVIAGRWEGCDFLKKISFNLKRKALKIAVFILVLCLFGAFFTGMYFLKKESADGRFLTWKVSLTALYQNPLGVGLGHFPSAYGEAQAAYFASGKATEMEEYIAGNPEYGFNEYLQIAIESGILSLLVFMAMIICAFRGLVKSKNWGVMGSYKNLLQGLQKDSKIPILVRLNLQKRL